MAFKVAQSPRDLISNYRSGPMPRIHDSLLHCVIYLYPTTEAANEGAMAGGSGFLVSVKSVGLPNNFWFVYAVSNKHVIENGRSRVISVNTMNNGKEIIETKRDDWHVHPDGYDLAACLISINPASVKFTCVPFDSFISHVHIMAWNIGPGDNVFVLGRFINHEGRQTNNPTARFGNIAQMPIEPIKRNDGSAQESYLVEARSIGGFSGSPVFWQVLPFGGGEGRIPTTSGIKPHLLGIDLGHIHSFESVVDKKGGPITGEDGEPMWVKMNTGMMGVVPAWKLTELLGTGPLAENRTAIEQSVKDNLMPGEEIGFQP